MITAKKKVIYFFLLLFALLAIIYQSAFTSQFFQDDQLNLEMARRGDIFELVEGANHWRPLPIQVFYGLGLNLFGQDAFFFHVQTFIFIALSLIALYGFIRRLGFSTKVSMLTVLFYSTNISLFANYFWIANSQFVLGALLFFLGGYFYLEKTNRGALLTILSLALGLLTNELFVFFPLFLVVVSYYRQYYPKRLMFLFGLSGTYFLLKNLILGLPESNAYQMQFDLSILSNLRWYLLRALNLPEAVSFTQTPIIGMLLILFVLGLGWGLIRRLHLKLLILVIGIFVTGALPFFFLPNHMSAHYLTIALVGPAILYARAARNRRILLFIVGCYLLMTVLGLEYLSKTHWIILQNTGPIGAFY